MNLLRPILVRWTVRHAAALRYSVQIHLICLTGPIVVDYVQATCRYQYLVTVTDDSWRPQAVLLTSFRSCLQWWKWNDWACLLFICCGKNEENIIYDLLNTVYEGRRNHLLIYIIYLHYILVLKNPLKIGKSYGILSSRRSVSITPAFIYHYCNLIWLLHAATLLPHFNEDLTWWRSNLRCAMCIHITAFPSSFTVLHESHNVRKWFLPTPTRTVLTERMPTHYTNMYSIFFIPFHPIWDIGPDYLPCDCCIQWEKEEGRNGMGRHVYHQACIQYIHYLW